METTLTGIDLGVAIVGAVVVGQSSMTAALLACLPRAYPARRWLLLFLAAVALVSGGDVVEHLRLQAVLWWVLPLSGAGLLCIGPALCLYVRDITKASQSPAAESQAPVRDALHFLPAVLLSAVLYIGAAAAEATKGPSPAHRSAEELMMLAPIAAHLLAYLVATARSIYRTRSVLKAAYSTLDGRTLNWLLVTALLLVAIVLCWMLSWTVSVGVSDLLTNALSSTALLVTGCFGIRQRNVFLRLPRDLRSAPTNPDAEPRGQDDAALSNPAPEPAREEKSGKYTRAALPIGVAQRLGADLQRVMLSEKPYLENDLTLSDLARLVGATPHQMSQLFSQHLGETFFDYVNRHRVDAVKATLARPQSAGRPLLEIALECGFGSKSTFNNTFRKSVGMSPSEYRRRQPGAAASAAL